VQQARQQQIAADLSLKELRGTLLPQVDLFANYGYTKSTSAVGILQSNQALGPDYGARVSIPLFRGLQLRSAKEVAEADAEQAAITTQQAELDLEESVLNAWTSYTLSAQRVALEEANLTGSRTQVDIALETFRLGAITSVELRDVQQGMVAAEGRLLVARYEAKLAELQLKWLAGRGPYCHRQPSANSVEINQPTYEDLPYALPLSCRSCRYCTTRFILAKHLRRFCRRRDPGCRTNTRWWLCARWIHQFR
jgi:outer membrane protein